MMAIKMLSIAQVICLSLPDPDFSYLIQYRFRRVTKHGVL